VRKQVATAKAVGCNTFDDEEMVVSIVLDGMSTNIKLYAATLAEKKATFLRSPFDVTLISLEETFFSIDNTFFGSELRNTSSKNHSSPFHKKKERANYVKGSESSSTSSTRFTGNCYKCGKPGHRGSECRSSGMKKTKSTSSYDKSKITCYICNEKGHYASECPKRTRRDGKDNNKKKVTFESAHIAMESEEHCKVAVTIDEHGKEISLSEYLATKDSDSSLSADRMPDLDDPNCDSSSDEESSSDDSSMCSVPELVARDCDSSSDEESNSDESSSESSSSNIDSKFDLETKPITFDSASLNHYLVEFIMMAAHRRPIDAPAIAFGLGDFALWLLDSGATSHFTPIFDDLIEPEQLESPIYIRVADGSRLRATHIGTVELNFRSEEGSSVVLRMLRVLYVPGLQTRLFSIESFVSNGRYKATYSRGNVRLIFRQDVTVNIPLPHVPPGTYVSREIADIPEWHEYEHGFQTHIHRYNYRVDDTFLEADNVLSETGSHFIGMALQEE
jgi:hypothetical protein